jgi:asparagine synthase (glutamine-hydrolysing)
MCGIAGLIRWDGAPIGDCLDRMVAALRHRGPDDAGTVGFDLQSAKVVDSAARAGAGIGLARLSIIDLSPAGHQPMANEDGGIWIAFNGEVYNFGEVRPWLERRGHAFRSRTDTEVLLHAYEEEGIGCLERFRGMFGLAIVDLPKRRLFLARDRLGLKPVKYLAGPQCFAFASEVKALLAVPQIPRRLDPVAVQEYLTYRCVPPPRTGIEGIAKLPAASLLELNLENRTHRITQYWSPPAGSRTMSDDEVVTEARLRFDEAVALRLIADVPVGVFLSGGLDSTAIVAAAARIQPRLRTYTVGFDDPRFDERAIARRVAERFGTEHHELTVTPHIAADVESIVRAFDEPFADPSALPSYYLAQATGAHVRVVLNGDGGDELFGGYKRYRAHRRTLMWQQWMPHQRGWLVHLSRALPYEIDKKRWRGRLGRLLLESSLPFERAYRMRFSGLDARAFAALRGAWWDDHPSSPDPLDRLAAAFGELPTRDSGLRLQDVDLVTYLPDDILVKSDLAGMAHSLEARSPFLDHRFVEFAVCLPGRWRSEKLLLKRLLAGCVPDEILGRKKMGFNPPIEGWMRRELAGTVRDRLLAPDAATAPLFQRAMVRHMIDRHQHGYSNLGEMIWLLLALEIWMQSFEVTP